MRGCHIARPRARLRAPQGAEVELGGCFQSLGERAERVDVGGLTQCVGVEGDDTFHAVVDIETEIGHVHAERVGFIAEPDVEAEAFLGAQIGIPPRDAQLIADEPVGQAGDPVRLGRNEAGAEAGVHAIGAVRVGTIYGAQTRIEDIERRSAGLDVRAHRRFLQFRLDYVVAAANAHDEAVIEQPCRQIGENACIAPVEIGCEGAPLRARRAVRLGFVVDPAPVQTDNDVERIVDLPVVLKLHAAKVRVPRAASIGRAAGRLPDVRIVFVRGVGKRQQAVIADLSGQGEVSAEVALDLVGLVVHPVGFGARRLQIHPVVAEETQLRLPVGRQLEGAPREVGADVVAGVVAFGAMALHEIAERFAALAKPVVFALLPLQHTQIEVEAVIERTADVAFKLQRVEAAEARRHAAFHVALALAGDDIHHAAHHGGTVDSGGRALENLHALHAGPRDVGQARGAGGPAIHQYQHALVDAGELRAETAKTDARQSARIFDHIDRRVLLDDVGEIRAARRLEGGRVDHLHRGCDIAQRLFAAGRGHDNGLDAVAIAGSVRRCVS